MEMFLRPHEGYIKKEDRQRINGHRSVIVWFTGLPSSGKSTLAHRLEEKLFGRGVRTFVIDGDNVRTGLNKDLGFSPGDREENIRRIGEVAKLLVEAGIVVMTAFISPYRKDRDFVRNLVNKDEFIIEEIVRVMDASSLNTYPKKEKVDRHEIAECIIKCSRAIAFDITEDNALTSRFVIVDGYDICGGGIVREALGDRQAWLRDRVILRNYKWEKSVIPIEARAEKYN